MQPDTKISDEQVLEMRTRAQAGESAGSIARIFEVSRVHVVQILRGHRRRAAGFPPPLPTLF